MKNKEIFDKYKDFSSKEFKMRRYGDEEEELKYEDYVAAQEIVNKRKIHLAGPSEKLIKQLSVIIRSEFVLFNKFLSQKGLPPQELEYGLCHGTRRGHEQEFFSKHTGAKVLGTEIADTAELFPNTIQWDFHDIKDEWKNRIDFIYSNSLDHSYDPVYCLRQWFKCLKVGGICILAYQSKGDSVGEEMKKHPNIAFVTDDPNICDGFNASVESYCKIINMAGNSDLIDGMPVVGLKYIINTQFMFAVQDSIWNHNTPGGQFWDHHFVIQKMSNKFVGKHTTLALSDK